MRKLTFVNKIEKGLEPIGPALDRLNMSFGGFVCISEEVVCYYRDEETFNEMSGDFPCVSLPRFQDSNNDTTYHYVSEVESHYTGGGCWIDVITLFSGMVIALTDECLNVYESYTELMEEWDGAIVIDYNTRSFSFPDNQPIPAEYRGNDYGEDE